MPLSLSTRPQTPPETESGEGSEKMSKIKLLLNLLIFLSEGFGELLKSFFYNVCRISYQVLMDDIL